MNEYVLIGELNWSNITKIKKQKLRSNVARNFKLIKAFSTSCYDVIVVRHKNQTLKSTAFQAVFGEKIIKRDPKKGKLKDLQFYVND